jgi:hypothetical protein
MKAKLGSKSLLLVSTCFFATILVTVVAFTTRSAPLEVNNETADDVVRVGNAAKPELNSILHALKDTQSIVARLGDRAFASQVFEAAKKNDKKGLADLLKTAAPGSRITIKEIDDFTITFSIGTESHDYTLCIGDKCKHPSGASSPIVFSQF